MEPPEEEPIMVVGDLNSINMESKDTTAVPAAVNISGEKLGAESSMLVEVLKTPEAERKEPSTTSSITTVTAAAASMKITGESATRVRLFKDVASQTNSSSASTPDRESPPKRIAKRRNAIDANFDLPLRSKNRRMRLEDEKDFDEYN